MTGILKNSYSFAEKNTFGSGRQSQQIALNIYEKTKLIGHSPKVVDFDVPLTKSNLRDIGKSTTRNLHYHVKDARMDGNIRVPKGDLMRERNGYFDRLRDYSSNQQQVQKSLQGKSLKSSPVSP